MAEFGGNRRRAALVGFSAMRLMLALTLSISFASGSGAVAANTVSTLEESAVSDVSDSSEITDQSEKSNTAVSSKTTDENQVLESSKAEAAEVIDSAKTMKAPIVGVYKAKASTAVLQTGISKNQSPFLEGHIQTVPKDTKIDITLQTSLCSEFSQKGDEIWARVSCDVPGGAGGHGPIMPGGWRAHGVVTEAQGEKRGHRSGYVSVEFDKIVSPDGQYEVDFKGKLTTKDSTTNMVAKQVATGTRFVGTGALGGTLLSLQVTGIGGAIATHGISLGVGAAIGGTIGAAGFANSKGGADTRYVNDDMQITIDQPIELPVFAPATFMSAKPIPHLNNMKIAVNGFKFAKDPYGDKQSKLLEVTMTIENHTNSVFSAKQISIVNDYDKYFSPTPNFPLPLLLKKIRPNTSEQITIAYEVDSMKHKYSLSLHNIDGSKELSRVPIN